MQPTPKLEKYFRDYASYHTTWGNELTHYIGIPLILVTLLGLLGGLELGLTNGGMILWALAVGWYLYLDWKIAIPFGMLALGGYLLGREMSLSWLWSLFIAGWIFQGIGHGVYEKRSPAFFKNLEHILIGPLWVFSRWVGYDRTKVK